MRRTPPPLSGPVPSTLTEVPGPDGPRAKSLTAAGAVLGLGSLVMLFGALAVRGGMAFGIVAVAVIFIPIEKLFALHPRKFRREGWRTDVVHFLVNNVISNALLIVPIVVIGLGLRALVPASIHHAIVVQPTWLQLIEAFTIAEFCGYAGHRAAHAVPALWRFHKVHHAITEMDWLAAGHLHPIDQVWTRSCVILPLFALGFTKAAFGGFIFLTTLQAIFIHANVRLTFGPLRWVVATPEFHHWHHANAPEAYNTNFAGEFPWIDALFGTLYLPKGQMPARYGIDDEQPKGYIRQLVWPFRSAAAQ